MFFNTARFCVLRGNEGGGMENIFKKRSWSPYAVGACLALLMVGCLFLCKKWIGASGAFISIVAFFEHLFAENYAATSAYFKEEMGAAPLISFRVLLIIGVVIGAFISAKLSGSYKPSYIPALWEARFGNCFAKRALAAFVGGVCVMLGAPLADGCTMSRGIFSGAMLDVSAWVFMGALFASAIAVSYLLYRGRAL